MQTQPSYIEILKKAFPLILANCATPLLGLVDTAVIGHYGHVAEQGAIALGGLIFSFLFWGFGFLRMSSSGFVAQAFGSDDLTEVRLIIARTSIIAVTISAIVLLVHSAIIPLALSLFDASQAVESDAGLYLAIRVFSMPASLLMLVVSGALVGLGKTKALLLIQLFLNGSNMLLDYVFVAVLHAGATGIAAGTVIAETLSIIIATMVLKRVLSQLDPSPEAILKSPRLRSVSKFKHLLSSNRDIMIRTLSMLFCFAWFTNQAAQLGDDALAATHILLQLTAFSAFFLDGFAFVAESYVGQAIGAKNRVLFNRSVRRSSIIAAVAALLLASFTFIAGEWVISTLTSHPNVAAHAQASLAYVAAYIALSFAAFQLDGIFIGATHSAAMRNASLAATLCYLTLSTQLFNNSSVQSLWLAFIIYLLTRALFLGLYFPRLKREAFIS